ncbi:MAG: ribosome small subunit-dependent GTPase A [Oscillospiraceae bacterium]
MTGIIKRAISGFYYVINGGKCYECRARGKFRKDETTPLVGDKVEFLIDENEKGIVTEILTRKNEFLRPPIANLDKLFIVVSTCEPVPSMLIIDKLTAICEYKDITPIIIITKTDLKKGENLQQIYENVGYKTISISNTTTNDFSHIKAEFTNCISAFAGNTGVGKSSLLNNIYKDLGLETSHISKKLGRGRHTTRQVELFAVENGYVADTPGFGTIEVEKYDIIKKDKLELCFKEFKPYLNNCKFTGCSHTCEKGCAIIEALNMEKIEKTRFESYVSMYNDAKMINSWDCK